ncbi:hypothetical protein HMPREF0946_01117 [Fusobacterium vincentii 3_1_36A2]|uniref:Uncharacterized protein n=1 Tax=Fusobacterium vincentii 3_1_36A2 TaxID=469604 RepID=C7XQF1_FUSVC|nr:MULTISPECIES: hypothetical protein [Fusobacterium]EEU33044.2 hypothetical protein HMPREF0946_01117 [Fusobacterium vincentii 3_1_36A2]
MEIEYQEVFDKIAVRIKNLNDDFFADGLLKEDVEKYNCQFLESPTDLEQRIIWIYDDIYLSDNDINCYCEEKIKQIKEFVDYVNEKYGIPKRWKPKLEESFFIVERVRTEVKWVVTDLIYKNDHWIDFYAINSGNCFKTYEEAEKVVLKLEDLEKNFWAKVREWEIGDD